MDRLDRIEACRFLGREFLAYLWFESERSEGAMPGEGERGQLWLEESLTLEGSTLIEKTKSVLTGSTPSLGPEAKEALRQGKLPTKAKIRLDVGTESYAFVFDADAFGLSSVKIPALVTEEEDETLYERMRLVERLEDRLGAIYEAFLRLRTSPKWEAEVLPAMRAWVKAEPWT